MAPNFIRAALDSESEVGGQGCVAAGEPGAAPSTLPLPRAREDWKFSRVRSLVAGPEPSPGAHPDETPKGTAGAAGGKLGASGAGGQSRCPAPRFHRVPHKRVPPSFQEAASQAGKPSHFSQALTLESGFCPRGYGSPGPADAPASSRAFLHGDAPACGTGRANCLVEMGRRPGVLP